MRRPYCARDRFCYFHAELVSLRRLVARGRRRAPERGGWPASGLSVLPTARAGPAGRQGFSVEKDKNNPKVKRPLTYYCEGAKE